APRPLHRILRRRARPRPVQQPPPTQSPLAGAGAGRGHDHPRPPQLLRHPGGISFPLFPPRDLLWGALVRADRGHLPLPRKSLGPPPPRRGSRARGPLCRTGPRCRQLLAARPYQHVLQGNPHCMEAADAAPDGGGTLLTKAEGDAPTLARGALPHRRPARPRPQIEPARPARARRTHPPGQAAAPAPAADATSATTPANLYASAPAMTASPSNS